MCAIALVACGDTSDVEVSESSVDQVAFDATSETDSASSATTTSVAILTSETSEVITGDATKTSLATTTEAPATTTQENSVEGDDASFDFETLIASVESTCQADDRYDVRAFSGVGDFWYDVNAQWYTLSTGPQIEVFLEVTDGEGNVFDVGEIPGELISDRARSAAILFCYENLNGDYSSWEDPGLYEPYRVFDRGADRNPPFPGG